jgi:hypothetical protein
MSPGTYTELFFRDEATALAAGHRPCALCQREKYRSFVAAWSAVHGAEVGWKAKKIDEILHAERLLGRQKRLHAMPEEPVLGMMVQSGSAVYRFTPRGWRSWSFGEYGEPVEQLEVDARLITPPSVVKILRRGFMIDDDLSELRV